MIEFQNINKEEPYINLYEFYKLALNNNQDVIEAFLVSSYCEDKKESDARFVNLKFVNKNEFIFFSNYDSPKSKQFKKNNNIACVIYWSSINLQIRMKGSIRKTNVKFNNKYFKNRSIDKNALAHSSNQSMKVSSYEKVIENFENAKINKNLKECPSHWGGFSFVPHYFEFWEGNENRVNKRTVYKKEENIWKKYYLQP